MIFVCAHAIIYRLAQNASVEQTVPTFYRSLLVLGKRLLIQQALDNGDVFATHSRFDAVLGLAICSNHVKPQPHKLLLQIQDSCF